MDNSTILIIFAFLFSLYFILRSKGEEKKPQAKPPQPPPLAPLPISPPALFKPIKKAQQITKAKVKKTSRAAAIHKLARKDKHWVIMNEVLTKKFPD